MANQFSYFVQPWSMFDEDTVGSKVKVPEWGNPEFSAEAMFVDAVAESRKASQYNEREGIPAANRIAGQINEQTLRDLESGMAQLYGGEAEFNRARDTINTNIQANLEGRLTPGTERLLTQRALSTGASNLGAGAFASVQSTALGLTSEQLAMQGANEYRSQYALFRQAYPMVTGLQTSALTALTPSQAIQSAHMNAERQMSYDFFGAEYEFKNQEALFNSRLTAAQYAAEPDPTEAAAAQQAMWAWGTMLGIGASYGGSMTGGQMGGM